ncbi:TetR/AcrR family transcriptional regulator [Nocardiopsis changdeensis]|uniref:TetR family transcriptional regulator C-terminal domain-containing protein n=1 Tax=Nocardiopsis changdeensis TaxID=2831969 RepID=A0ABX8BWZ3_9ACTN|nr:MULTISPECIES: TetR/AcrR family transcriptional regulator [Nocardiopsis]QUX24863.1 TetR family transcriptional regulator C-terminal domain-containing protein [Nocardiopsis changdeensis]QYX35249.1 TetR/AcrR family transcriptional regulator [Nocardiopsis sp. MT53]
MPRTADHDQRRAQIADAVTDLIASGGLAAVTVARTADRAGISVGLVQHYFPAKDDMLLHAFERVGAAVAARVADVIAGGVRHERSIADVLAAALAEYLPLDGRRRAEFRVTRTFAGRALENPRLAEVDARTAATMRAEIARAVTNGFECGEVDPAADPALAAARLAAATEGLATALYRDPGERDRALAVLRAEIDAVFTGECRQYTG